MKTIPLNTVKRSRHSGKAAIVDDEDYEWLMQWKWSFFDGRGGGAARRTEKGEDGKQRSVWMHREILKAPNHLEIDHINRNGLDNRRANLRLATRSQNAMNMPGRKAQGASSKYKGVCWCNTRKAWIVHITADKRTKFLGYYDSETEAARAYDRAAIEKHGAFAVLNFPEVIP